MSNKDKYLMYTYSGKAIDLHNISTEQIVLSDITRGLSNINRYNGGTSEPFSVLQHSLLVHELIKNNYKTASDEILLAALLHDAHEVYIGDMATPIKSYIQSNRDSKFVQLANDFDKVLYEKFFNKLTFDSSIFHLDIIKQADATALILEGRTFLPHCNWYETEDFHNRCGCFRDHLEDGWTIDINNNTEMLYELIESKSNRIKSVGN